MKNKTLIILIGLLFTGLFTIQAQEIKKSDVPEAVKSTFMKDYKGATDIEWKKDGDNFMVSFDMGRVDHKATYSATGTTISFQKEIPSTSLPAVIAKNIKTKYPNARIDDVEWKNTSGKIIYKIDLDGKPDVKVWYGEDGTFMEEIAD